MELAQDIKILSQNIELVHVPEVKEKLSQKLRQTVDSADMELA